MKNKKLQLAALGTLLVLVIAAGAWLVLRAPGESAPDVPPAGSGGIHTSMEFQPFDISGFMPSAYRPVRQGGQMEKSGGGFPAAKSVR